MSRLPASLFVATLPAALFGRDAVAQQAANAPPPQLFSAGYIAQVLGSLTLVFLGIFLVVFFLRRVNRIGGGPGGALRVLASASVGQRERVVLIEVGEEQLLIGVAPGNVRALHALQRPVEAPGTRPAQAPADFASLLRSARSVGAGSRTEPGAGK
jgi:flagellar protein FliO/FliZ